MNIDESIDRVIENFLFIQMDFGLILAKVR